MLDFRCSNCQATVTVNDDERALTVTCPACNTRQPVPPSAAPTGYIGEPPAFRFFNRQESSNAAPQYHLANAVGASLIIGGAILAALTIITMFTNTGPVWILLWGFPCLGIGVITHLLREMAIDLWHIRYRKN